MIRLSLLLAVVLQFCSRPLQADSAASAPVATLSEGFRRTPDAARPWVCYFIMDGKRTREGITADFEAIQRQR